MRTVMPPMKSLSARRAARRVLCTLGALACAACMGGGDRDPVAPDGASRDVDGAARYSAAAHGKIDVCHRTGNGAHTLQVAAPAWPAHRAHGDYPTTLIVDPAASNDDLFAYPRLTRAVQVADSIRRVNNERTVGACRITIDVAAGSWQGGYTSASSALERFPLAIVVPDITLQGALALATDAEGRAQESAGDTHASRLVPDANAPRGSAVVLVSSDAAGFVAHRTSIRGFHWIAGSNTQLAAIGAQRVTGLSVAGNLFEGTFSGALDARGIDARVSGNVVRGHAACGFCLAGPGRFEVVENRLEAGAFVGVFVAAAVERAGFPLGTNPLNLSVPDDVVPTAPRVDATVTHNLMTGYTLQQAGLGAAVRVVSFSPSPLLSARAQSVSARVQDNEFARVTFGVIVDANLLASDGSITGSTTTDLILARNRATQVCRAPLVLAFSRVSQLVAPAPTFPYVAHSTLRITSDAGVVPSNAWRDHPAGLGNTLSFNGVPLAEGRVVPSPLPPPSC